MKVSEAIGHVHGALAGDADNDRDRVALARQRLRDVDAAIADVRRVLEIGVDARDAEALRGAVRLALALLAEGR
jgi:hypothetical protein